jgi:general stress protein 26
MNETVLEFLQKHRVCSLTTLLKDGSPHSAALHFSHNSEPLELYFSTENTSRKCEAIVDGSTVKGSVVVGFSEEEWITLQMDGEVQAVLDTDELQKVHRIHYAKHPDAEQYKSEPETIILKFTPKWWRYTDFNTEQPTILVSKR